MISAVEMGDVFVVEEDAERSTDFGTFLEVVFESMDDPFEAREDMAVDGPCRTSDAEQIASEGELDSASVVAVRKHEGDCEPQSESLDATGDGWC